MTRLLVTRKISGLRDITKSRTNRVLLYLKLCNVVMENIVIFSKISKISDIFDIYRIYINILIYIEYLSDACIMQ